MKTKTRKPCTQWIWAKNDDCLRNGSFIRQDWSGKTAGDGTQELTYTQYINGDYMGEIKYSYAQICAAELQGSAPEYAKRLVPKCCMVKI